MTVSGTHWDGSKYAALMSSSPGDMYSDMGVNVVGYERLVLHDQAHANFLSGRLFSLANQDVLEVNMSLAGDYPVEIVPQAWWTLKDMDTKRDNVDLENVKSVPRHVVYHIDILNGAVYPEVTFEPEAVDILGDGTTMEVPVDPTKDNPNPSVDPSPNIPISITTIGTFGVSVLINDLTPSKLIGAIYVPFACKILSVTLVTDPHVMGNVVMDIWKCTYAQIADTVHPVVGDSIVGTHKPTLVAEDKSATVISDWTVNLNMGDYLYIYINSASVLTWVTLTLTGLAYQ